MTIEQPGIPESVLLDHETQRNHALALKLRIAEKRIAELEALLRCDQQEGWCHTVEDDRDALLAAAEKRIAELNELNERIAELEAALIIIRQHYTSDQNTLAGQVARAVLNKETNDG